MVVGVVVVVVVVVAVVVVVVAVVVVVVVLVVVVVVVVVAVFGCLLVGWCSSAFAFASPSSLVCQRPAAGGSSPAGTPRTAVIIHIKHVAGALPCPMLFPCAQ